VNACSRSPDGAVLATGDDCGRVNLFRFPCPQPLATSSQSIGHSAHVTNVSFSPATEKTKERLLSAGGADQCVFQWKYRYHRDAADDQGSGQVAHGAGAVDEEELPFFNRQKEGEEDGALAVKPFMNAVL